MALRLLDGASMMQRSSILFAFLGLGLTVVACSGTSTGTSGSTGSSGSNPQLGGEAKMKTCKNESLNAPNATYDDPCSNCQATECAAEGAVALGNDPSAFGGACSSTMNCVCDCSKSDQACLAACPAASKACNDALSAVIACSKAKCTAQCAKDGG
jgi:hypothetical protein